MQVDERGELSFRLLFPRVILQFQTPQAVVHAHGVGAAHIGSGRAAVRADIPRQFHQPVAVLSVLLEFGVAVRR